MIKASIFSIHVENTFRKCYSLCSFSQSLTLLNLCLTTTPFKHAGLTLELQSYFTFIILLFQLFIYYLGETLK